MTKYERPCKARHQRAADYAPVCVACRAATSDARYAAWGEYAGPGPKPPRFQLPVCPHLGDATGVKHPCKTCGGRDADEDEFACALHGTCTKNKLIAGVKNCKICEDRVGPAPRPDPWAVRVLCPPAPAIDLKPRSKTAVVSLAFGDKGRAESAISRPFMEKFAARIGADFRLLTWPGIPEFVFSSKFAIARAAEQYDRILYLDADVIPRPGCVNPFDYCRPGAFGAVDEAAYHICKPEWGRAAEYRRFLKECKGLPETTPIPWAFNAGIMVIPRELAWVCGAPTEPIPTYHCAEQDTVNARVLFGDVDYQLLDRRCNWQWWQDHDFRDAPADAILHFSATGNNRLGLMRGVASRY